MTFLLKVRKIWRWRSIGILCVLFLMPAESLNAKEKVHEESSPEISQG